MTVLRSQSEMAAPIQCANMTFAPAWMRKMSSASTGLYPPGVNGDAAAAVSVLANNTPVVACNPTTVAPSPTKFTVRPVLSCRTTSARGGTRSSCVTAACSFAPSLPMPRLQNVVKYAHRMPNRMKYSPGSVALVMFLKSTEKITMTAETVARMSWPQKPHRPRVRHAFAVRCTFFAMLAVESSGDLSAARVTAGRRERDARPAAGADRAHCSDARGAEPACAARWVSARAAAGTRAREPRAPADTRSDATGRRDARARDAMGARDNDDTATVGRIWTRSFSWKPKARRE